MNVALSVQINDAFMDIARLTVPVMQSYALRHGYSLYVHKSHQVSPSIVWQRIIDVKELVHHHDVVVHLDADCLITNPEITIEEIMAGDDADLFMSTDCNGINDGFHIWRDTWAGSLVRNRLLESVRDYSSPQAALSDPAFLGNFNMKPLPQRLTNSYRYAEYGQEHPEGEWSGNDFILHLPGIGNDRRVEILKSLIYQP